MMGRSRCGACPQESPTSSSEPGGVVPVPRSSTCATRRSSDKALEACFELRDRLFVLRKAFSDLEPVHELRLVGATVQCPRCQRFLMH